jgi:hypothetical protein
MNFNEDRPILNLTQHVATKSQLEAGLIEPSSEEKQAIKVHLTINDVNTEKELEKQILLKASWLAKLIYNCQRLNGINDFLVGGHPKLLLQLAKNLKYSEADLWMSHSDRIVIEENGVKKSEFKHLFFYRYGLGVERSYMDMPTVIL